MYKIVGGNVLTIKEFIEDKGIEVDQVIRTSNIAAKYQSFKVLIQKTDVNAVISFWPSGVSAKL